MIKLFKFFASREIEIYENQINAFISTENAIGRRWRLAGPAQIGEHYIVVTLVWDDFK